MPLLVKPEIMYPKNGALACVGSDVLSFWYRWNEFLVKFTRSFCVVAKITFLFCQTNIFSASVLRRKMKMCGGAQSFSGNNSALKKYFECSKLPFSIF